MPEEESAEVTAAVQAFAQACGEDAAAIVEALQGARAPAALPPRARAIYEQILASAKSNGGGPWVALEPRKRTIAAGVMQYGCMFLVALWSVFAMIGIVTVITNLIRGHPPQ
jgi:hypothetical protein